MADAAQNSRRADLQIKRSQFIDRLMKGTLGVDDVQAQVTRSMTKAAEQMYKKMEDDPIAAAQDLYRAGTQTATSLYSNLPSSDATMRAAAPAKAMGR